MSKRTPPTMTDLLRQALSEAPSMREVGRQTGTNHAALSRFLKGEQSIRLDKADALAAHFGITSKPKRRR
jgi:plasmid maintenance system antidote protein VapI